MTQSVRDLRVLIIDDASSDKSLAVANKLAEADKRVRVISHAHNRGHIETYNEGIASATADYFLLLSADDLLVPGTLERATGIMDANPDVVLTHGKCVIWQDDRPFPQIEDEANGNSWARHNLIDEMCRSAANFVSTPTAVVRTCTQKTIGGYRASLRHSGDMEMWLRFAANGSVARVDAIQAIYRKHSTAMSNAYFADMLSDYRQCQLAFDTFFDEYDGHLNSSRRLRGVARRALAGRVFKSGITLVRRGRFSDGSRLIRAAMDMDHRLRYRPPLWQLVKVPGPAGREWARSAIADASRGIRGLSKTSARKMPQ